MKPLTCAVCRELAFVCPDCDVCATCCDCCYDCNSLADSCECDDSEVTP